MTFEPNEEKGEKALYHSYVIKPQGGLDYDVYGLIWTWRVVPGLLPHFLSRFKGHVHVCGIKRSRRWPVDKARSLLLGAFMVADLTASLLEGVARVSAISGISPG